MARRRTLLLLFACLVAWAAEAAAPAVAQRHETRSSSRRLLLRDFPGASWLSLGGSSSSSSSSSSQCRNTEQGLLLITDDRGVLCPRDAVDASSGCCQSGPQHTCERCTLADSCCAGYEECVSCCLAPRHDAGRLCRSTLRFPSYPKAGYYADAWEYCSGVCRTHKGSTVHENAYISNRHHCFSKLRRPMLSAPLPPGALARLAVVVSDANQDCDVACGKQSLKCSARDIALLNSCDRLREKVGCEAGCEVAESKEQALAAPSYVTPRAQKAKRPAMCFTAAAGPEAAAGALQCAYKAADTQRLCACELSEPKWEAAGGA